MGTNCSTFTMYERSSQCTPTALVIKMGNYPALAQSERAERHCEGILFTITPGVSDEFHGSPPSRGTNTTKLRLSPPIFYYQGFKHEKNEEIERNIDGEVKTFTAKC